MTALRDRTRESRVHWPPVGGALSAANRAIREDFELALGRQEAARLTRRPLLVIDVILNEMEEMHLAGLRRVPDAFVARLDHVGGDVSGEALGIRAEMSISSALDRLFRAQERFLQTAPRIRLDVDGAHATSPPMVCGPSWALECSAPVSSDEDHHPAALADVGRRRDGGRSRLRWRG